MSSCASAALAVPKIQFDAVATAAASTAASATELETVVVTARRREENLQDTPVAVTAISAATLERRNIATLDQLARLAPTLTVFQVPGGIGASGAFIRGIGNAEYLPSQDNPVAYYYDGVIAGRSAVGMMDLAEPERVEVLRGPQGTLFGRNTTAGAILITTHTPTDEFSGMAKASYGTFAAINAQVRIDTGLIGNTGIKLSTAFQHRQQNGSFDAPGRPDNLDPGAQDTNVYWFKAVGGWGKLSATLSGDYETLKGSPMPEQIVDANAATRNFLAQSVLYGGPAYTISKTKLDTLPEGFAGTENVWSEGLSLSLNYELNEHITLKSITALQAYERNDAWAFGPQIFANVGTVAAPRIVSFDGIFELGPRGQGQRQRSQELQLQGAYGDFNYVAGAYYFKEGVWDFSRTRIPSVVGTGLTAIDFVSPRLFTVGSDSIAGFAQVDWRPSFFDKKLELTGGIRTTKDKRTFAQTAPLVRTAKLETQNTSFLVSADYQWTPAMMTFLKYSTGYRAGGFNARAGATVDPIFRPEKLKSLEAGFKFDLFENRLRVNGALYHNDYEDLQVSEYTPPIVGSAGGNVAINANARYQGGELEIQAVPIERLTLTASAGVVDRFYKTYPRNLAAGAALTPGCKAIAGTTIAQDCAAIASFTHNPKTSSDFSAYYVLPAADYGEWSFFVAYSHKGRVDYSAFDLPPASPNHAVIAGKAYGLLSARIALSHIPLSGHVRGQIAIYGDNLTDQDYVLQGTELATYAGIAWAPGRTVGVEGKVEF